VDEVSMVDLFGWWRGCRRWGLRRKSCWSTGGNRMNDVVTIAAVGIARERRLPWEAVHSDEGW